MYVCMYVCMHVYIYIYIYISVSARRVPAPSCAVVCADFLFGLRAPLCAHYLCVIHLISIYLSLSLYIYIYMYTHKTAYVRGARRLRGFGTNIVNIIEC